MWIDQRIQMVPGMNLLHPKNVEKRKLFQKIRRLRVRGL